MPVFMPCPPTGLWMCAASPSRNARPLRNRSATRWCTWCSAREGRADQGVRQPVVLRFSDIGAWALTTSDGIILLDTLNTPEEATDIVVPALQKVGLDPARIKAVILSHGHFDHFGGAPYLQDRSRGCIWRAPIVMPLEGVIS